MHCLYVPLESAFKLAESKSDQENQVNQGMRFKEFAGHPDMGLW